MSLVVGQLRSLVMLLLYLAGSMIVELAHHDEMVLAGNAQPVLASHGCGSTEKHIPIDEARHCLACSPFAQRFASGSSHVVTIGSFVVCFTFRPGAHTLPSTPDILSSGERGPPLG